MAPRRRLAWCILVASAATAIRAPRRSATALAVRGGATAATTRGAPALTVRGGATKTKTKSSKSKAKKMDPTGTPVVAKLLRPATALQAKYEAIAAEDPMRGLLIQVGGTMVTMKVISRVLKKSGDKQAALVGRMLYVAYLALHQLILNYVESRIEILDDESALTIPGNPMLAQLAKQQSQGGGEVAQALVEKLASKETTVKAYDLDMVLKGRRSQVGSLCVTAYLHLKKGMVQPLVANVIMGLVALLRDPLVRVHVLGEDVERPFAPPSRRGSRPCRRSRPRPPRRRPRRAPATVRRSRSRRRATTMRMKRRRRISTRRRTTTTMTTTRTRTNYFVWNFCLARRYETGRFCPGFLF